MPKIPEYVKPTLQERVALCLSQLDVYSSEASDKYQEVLRHMSFLKVATDPNVYACCVEALAQLTFMAEMQGDLNYSAMMGVRMQEMRRGFYRKALDAFSTDDAPAPFYRLVPIIDAEALYREHGNATLDELCTAETRADFEIELATFLLPVARGYGRPEEMAAKILDYFGCSPPATPRIVDLSPPTFRIGGLPG